MRIKYPFQPKSTAHLRPGQFWAVPLHRPGFLDYPGWYGCGLVLDVVEKSRRWFLAGLLDWADAMPPTAGT